MTKTNTKHRHNNLLTDKNTRGVSKPYNFEGQTLYPSAIAKIVGLSACTVRKTIAKLGYPRNITRDMLPTPKPRAADKYKDLTYNGRPYTLGRLAKLVGKSETFVRYRVKEYGLDLRTEHLRATSEHKPDPQQMNSTFAPTTPAERKKLARIPSPTPYELKYFGDDR